MKIKWIRANPFGGIEDRRLDFESGLNVVWGKNESGKSTWHGAVYSLICGKKKGSQRAEDKDFTRRYRPWDSNSRWRVEGEVETAEGETLSILQDLETPSSSQIVANGLIVTHEYEKDGMPDLSPLFGFTREVFANTAFIKQTGILSLVNLSSKDKDSILSALQEATGDIDVRAALNILEETRRKEIGLVQKSSTGPLIKAIERASLVQDALFAARENQQEYLAKVKDAKMSKDKVISDTQELAQIELAIQVQSLRKINRQIKNYEQEEEKYVDLSHGSSDPTLFEAVASWLQEYDHFLLSPAARLDAQETTNNQEDSFLVLGLNDNELFEERLSNFKKCAIDYSKQKSLRVRLEQELVSTKSPKVPNPASLNVLYKEVGAGDKK